MASLAAELRHVVHPMHGGPDDFTPLVERVGDARFVLLGEATHGTHEFYRLRAQLTKRLILEKGFHAVALEADWPDAYRVNRYVRGTGDDSDASEALDGFKRFPQWMWRNADVLDFVGWLRAHNDALRASDPRVGVYGLDLYSLYASIGVVLRLLERLDPEAAARARARYACFEPVRAEPHVYAFKTALGLAPSCERQAVEQLLDLRNRAILWARRGNHDLVESTFELEQNARVVRDAEAYYRNMIDGGVQTWNLRDEHMTTTLGELAEHLDRTVGRSKIVVWEHNSHVGDARATYMHQVGEWNVGQLMRERFGADVYNVGWTTYEGSVTAASDWGAPAERMRVRPAEPDSYEALFHRTGLSSFLLLLGRDTDMGVETDVGRELRRPRQERAIGVVYRPLTERSSHYFEASLTEQFDAVIHVDSTRAVEPLERTAPWVDLEPPETYPSTL